MRIVHIISSLHGGGKERRLVQLVKGLHFLGGYIVRIYIISPFIDYNEVGEYAQVTVLNNSSRINLMTSLYRNLKKDMPDIVHEWSGMPVILCSLSLFKSCLKFKYIEGFIADGNSLKTLQERLASWLSYTIADAIVSNSQAGLIAKHAVRDKATVIYNGFDYGRIKNVTELNVAKLRKELNITDTQYIVSMLARLEPAKDWMSFLRLAKLVQEKRNDIVFLAVGKGKQSDFLMKEQKRLGVQNVRFLGFRNDAECIIAASSLTILFTNEIVHAEGVSNSIMESMALGVPVIASKGGGTPEIISDGVDGYIVPPNDYVLASQKVFDLINDSQLHLKMSIASKEKVKTKFLLNRMTRLYVELYNKITSINEK